MSVLRYTALPEVLPRHELAPGRRLGSGGVLSGALHTLGYYSTDVCLGSPGRHYDLIIDTGSSITAVPCSGCQQCGTHHCGRAGYFDTSKSPSSRTVNCHEPPPSPARRCHSRRCSSRVMATAPERSPSPSPPPEPKPKVPVKALPESFDGDSSNLEFSLFAFLT